MQIKPRGGTKCQLLHCIITTMNPRQIYILLYLTQSLVHSIINVLFQMK